MGEVIQFPSVGDLEFRRTVRAVERFMRDYLADGPQIIQKVRDHAEHISTNRAHFDEARRNLGIRRVEDSVKHRWYWALPGDEGKVPNVQRYSYLPPRNKPWLAREEG
jgi:hypothetical protein